MVVILLPIAFSLVVYFAWRNKGVRGCRWRADRSGDKGSLRMYRCMACGAEAFTASKGPPDTCKKGLGGPSL